MQNISYNETLLHKYQSTHLLGYEVTHNRIIFLTNNHLTLINLQSHSNAVLTDVLKVNGKNVLKFSTNKNNLIAILYASGVLQVRRLDSIQEVQQKFTNVQCRKNCSNGQAIFLNRGSNSSPFEFPKIYWDSNQIYLLYEEKMEIISMAMKERKAYNDIINSTDGEKINGMALSKLIENQRIVIMQFKNKLTFNIVPIPITFMNIAKVTQISSVCTHLANQQNGFLLREYLILVINDNTLQVYNIISMKLIMQIGYSSKKKKNKEKNSLSIQFKTDAYNQFLIVTVYHGKTIHRHVLYKINTEYYYTPCKEYFKEEQPFFLWEIQIPITYPILLIPPPLNHQVLEAFYFKHDTVYGEGQIKRILISIKNSFNTEIKQNKRKSSGWKQLREWKDIITSYIEMKNTLDQIDLGLNDDEGSIVTPVQQNQQTLAENIEEDARMMKQLEQSSKQIEETEKQYRKYQRIKFCLEDAAKKFQNQRMHDIMEIGEEHNQEKQKRLEEEFYKFMKIYLKENELDFMPQNLCLEIQRKKKLPAKQKDTQPHYQQPTKKEQWNNESGKGSVTPSKNEQQCMKQSGLQKKIYLNSSSCELLKSGGQTDHSKEIIAPDLNEEDNYCWNQEQDQINQLYLGIQKSICKGFEPIQKKLDSLNNHIARYEDSHVEQLNRCFNIVEKERKYLNNIDSIISGYCNELMQQFNANIEKGLKSYWRKIEEIDEKTQHHRNQTIDQFGKLIDKQIKNREFIFDEGRLMIENHLSHIRKKIHLGQDPFPSQEEQDEIEDYQDAEEQVFENDCILWLKKFHQKQSELFRRAH